MNPRVVILTGIFPPDIGGPATSVPDLARSLVADGHDVVVVTLAADTRRREDDPFPVIRIPRDVPRARRVAAVWRAVTSARPDVVLANGLHLESALLPRVPVVQKIVGDWAWERAQNAGATDINLEDFQTANVTPRVRALRLLRSAVTRRARLVIVPSSYLADVVGRWSIPSSRIRVIPNAAPPVDDEGPQVPRGDQALYVGRLVAWKHIDHVLRVLPRVPETGLDVVGVGPRMNELQSLTVTLDLGDRVSFLGQLPREEVLDRMRRARFLVLPSSYEGMPHVVLEAFARGLPVVASDAGGTPELVRDGVSGLLYPWGDLDALEEAMATILAPEIAANVIHGGFAVARRFSASATAQATREVLREMLT